MRLFALLLTFSPLWAQAVSLGLRVGIPLNPALTAGEGNLASTPRYTIGPLVEIRLWQDAALGADFLFSHTEARRWEAPITFIYRFRAPVRPFLRAGVSFNRVLDESIPGAELRHRSTSGFVAGGGVRFRLARLRFDPELRLTRWRDRNFGVRDSAVRSNLTQVALLAGVIF